MSKLKIEYRPVADLIPYAQNARTHSAEQVAQIVASIQEFGWTNPVLVDGANGVIAGHGRLIAAQELGLESVPVIELAGLTDTQKRAYVIADNKLAMNAGWNIDTLGAELGDLKQIGFDLELTGFSLGEIDDILGEGSKGGAGSGSETPDPEAAAVSQLGNVWLCGAHRVMCGDSVLAYDVDRLMGGTVGHLLHADPPYGMGKEADGVANDNLYGDKLDGFQMAWWKTYRPHIAANGSAYIWGNAPDLWRLWYRPDGLAMSEPLTLRNEIVWDKKTIPGMASDEMTQYPNATERCLFFHFGEPVNLVATCKEQHWPGWEPFRLTLIAERDKAGWNNAQVNKICGNWMAGHWFGTSQWCMISREHYERLRDASNGTAFLRPYDDFNAEYQKADDVFRLEVREPNRVYFDNAHAIMRDVWEFGRVNGDERQGHATPKPVDMMERLVTSSAPEGGVVVEPFGGSGSTVMGCEKTGRACYCMELEPVWADVIVKRWQAFTGKTATLEGDGRTFDEVATAAESDAEPITLSA